MMKIALTFDDGTYDDFWVMDFLKERHIPATFFIPIHSTDWEENDLHDAVKRGFEIGSHSLSHRFMTSNHMGQKEMVKECTVSREILEEKVGRVYGFAYPHGRFDTSTVDSVQKAGYMWARACQSEPSRWVWTMTAYCIDPEFSAWRLIAPYINDGLLVLYGHSALLSMDYLQTVIWALDGKQTNWMTMTKGMTEASPFDKDNGQRIRGLEKC